MTTPITTPRLTSTELACGSEQRKIKPDYPQSASYAASCHCGAVGYAVTLTPPLAQQQPVSCTCTICSRNGYLLVYPLRSDLVLTQGADVLKLYSFGRKRNWHQFCGHCGSSVFFDPRMVEHGESPDLLGVNVGAKIQFYAFPACGEGRS